MQHLKDVGVGKSSLEGMILDEIRDLIMDLKVITSWSNANMNILFILWEFFASECCGFLHEQCPQVGKRIHHCCTQHYVGNGVQ